MNKAFEYIRQLDKKTIVRTLFLISFIPAVVSCFLHVNGILAENSASLADAPEILFKNFLPLSLPLVCSCVLLLSSATYALYEFIVILFGFVGLAFTSLGFDTPIGMLFLILFLFVFITEFVTSGLKVLALSKFIISAYLGIVFKDRLEDFANGIANKKLE